MDKVIEKGKKVNLCSSMDDNNDMIMMWNNCFDSNGQLVGSNVDGNQSLMVNMIDVNETGAE